MNVNDDRRSNPRVRVKVRLVMIDEETGRRHLLHTTNLSAGGARCTTQDDFAWGQVLNGSLFLPLSEGGRDLDVPIRVRAKVIRTSAGTSLSACSPYQEIAIAFEMSETDRDELRRFLLNWMAADSWSHPVLVGEEA